jgi:class 3 adenylate cyclase
MVKPQTQLDNRWNYNSTFSASKSSPALGPVILCQSSDGWRGALSETRKLAAILVADVVGYSRLAGTDEERILARLRALRSDLIDLTIALRHGRVAKRTGDGSLIEFRSVVDAVRGAIEVQTGMVERNWVCRPKSASSFASAFTSATLLRRATPT